MRTAFLSGIVVFFTALTLVLGGNVVLPEGEMALENGCFNATGSGLAGWRLRSGSLGQFELTEPQEGSSEPVLTMTVRKADPKPWMMELQQPVRRRVEKGTAMYITFEYKMTKGYSFQFYWQVERAPWPKLLSMRLTSPENAWHRVRVWAPVHETYQPEMTAFSFHLAEAPGILQLREMYAVILPNGFDLETLETTDTAVLGGDFYDRVWRGEVTEKMLQQRRLPLDIRVFKRRPAAGGSKNHPPAANAVVLLKQTSRPFVVGASVCAGLAYPEYLSQPAFDTVRKTLAKARIAPPKAYLSRILSASDLGMVYNGEMAGWPDYQSWGQQVADRLAADVSQAGKQLIMGGLYIPLFSAMQPGFKDLERTEANEKLQQWIEGVLKKHAGKVERWCVLHDVISCAEVYNQVGVDSLVQAIQSARRGNPQAQIFISDSRALNEISEVPLQDFLEFVCWMRDTMGVQVDGFVLDAGMSRLDVGPQTLEARLNAVAGRCPGVPLHIVNLAVNMPREGFQADMLKDYMTLFYSQPNIRSVSLGELWSPAASIPAMGYLREDFTPKPSYAMIQKLLNEDWLGNDELKTDDSGLVAYDAFGGDYQVKVICENRTSSFTIHFPDNLHKAAEENWVVHGEDFDAKALPPAGQKVTGRAMLNIYLKE